MSEFQEVVYPIQGVDRATPADESQPGSCLAIENLVPVGPPGSAYWSVATAPEQKGSSTGILSLGRQTRNRIGPLAAPQMYPNVQSRDRLVALKADGIYVIDPNSSYAEAQLYAFNNSDSTRRATFTSLGESVFISVTRTTESRPEAFLELRGDRINTVGWAPLPLFSVSWSGESNSDYLPEGTYVFRLAWQLDDGSIGPATGPGLFEPVPGSTSYIPSITIERWTRPPGAAWENRASNLVLIGHAPTMNDSGDVEVKAINNPGYIIAQLEGEVGATASFEGSVEDLIGSRAYPPPGLTMHDTEPGALYSYNQRLILGDIGMDLYRPNLRRILDWNEDKDDGSTLYWVILEIKIRTASGIITRYSQPLPFDSNAATSVNTRNGVIFYRDERAYQWRLLVSTDHTENSDPGQATWKTLAAPGVDRSFEEAAGSFYSFRDVRQQEPFDLTNVTEAAVTASSIDPDNDGTDEWVAINGEEHALGVGVDAYANGGASSGIKSRVADVELEISKVLSGDLEILTVTSFVDANVTGDDEGSSFAGGSILIEILNSAGTMLADLSHDTPGLYEETLSDANGDFNSADAHSIRIKTEVNAEAVSLGDVCEAEADASANEVFLSTGTSDSEPVDVDPVEENKERDRSPTKIIWSEPYQPLNRPAENLVYAGDENADPVYALQAVGQTVSEGQFGQYPIVCMSENSVRMLEVGTDPFIQNVSPLTTEMGIVGRRAHVAADGSVVAVTDRGVYAFNPQLEKPALSELLHDVRDAFLNDLTSETSIGFYAEEDRGRREIWIAGSGQTWVYSLKHGMWCQLSRQRRDFARLDNRLRGVDTSGQIQQEFGSTSTQVDFTVVTGLEHFGEVGYMERLKTLLVQQRFNMEELRWKLVTKDPNAAQALKAEPLNRATLPDGLTARDLLPNVLVDSGTDSTDRGPIVRGDTGTIFLPRGIGYSWFARFEGTGEPDQGIEGWGAEFEPRRRVRAATFFPDQPETVVLSFEVDADAGDEVDLSFLDASSSPAGDVAAILWGDGTSDSTGDATHTYGSAGVYTIQVVAQPDFGEVTEGRLAGAIDLSTLDLSDCTDLATVLIEGATGPATPFGNATTNTTPDDVTDVELRSGGDYEMSEMPSQADRMVINRVDSVTGPLTDAPSASHIEIITPGSDASMGTPDQSWWAGGVTYLDARNMSSLTIDLDAARNGDTGITYILSGGVTNTGSARDFLAAVRTCNRLSKVNFQEDLSGQNGNGDPIIPPNTDVLSGRVGPATVPFDDWRNTASNAIVFNRNSVAGGSQTGSANAQRLAKAGGSYSDALASLSNLGASQGLIGALEDGVDHSQLSLRSDRNALVLAHDLYDKILSYSNMKEVLYLDAGRPRQILSVDLTTPDDAEVVVDDPNGDVDSLALSNSGGQTYDRYHIVEAGSEVNGEYTIQSSSHDSSNGETTLVLNKNDGTDPSSKSVDAHSTGLIFLA